MTLSRRPPFSSFAAGRQQKKNKSPAICHQQKRRRRRRLECLIASISLLANPQLPSNKFAIPIKKEKQSKTKENVNLFIFLLLFLPVEAAMVHDDTLRPYFTVDESSTTTTTTLSTERRIKIGNFNFKLLSFFLY